MNKKNVQSKVKFIYNPHAGKKRNLFSILRGRRTALEDIQKLLAQYQIQADYFPTKAPGHATELAKNAQKEGYQMIIVAGGDGTVGEAANGIIGSDISLAILPLGSFMNIARMLSIPFDLEKAVMLIRIGRCRKIDAGSITSISGKKLKKPYYFFESLGMGLDAQLQNLFLQFETGKLSSIWQMVKTLFEYYGHQAQITLDNEIIRTRATLVTVSNGPYSSAALPLAPQSKLNDHRLTIRLFRMRKGELIRYLLRLLTSGKTSSKKVVTYQTKKIVIDTRTPRLIHADARFFGTTPVECMIVPNAVNVITGYPKSKDPHSLIKRTYLDY